MSWSSWSSWQLNWMPACRRLRATPPVRHLLPPARRGGGGDPASRTWARVTAKTQVDGEGSSHLLVLPIESAAVLSLGVRNDGVRGRCGQVGSRVGVVGGVGERLKPRLLSQRGCERQSCSGVGKVRSDAVADDKEGSDTRLLLRLVLIQRHRREAPGMAQLRHHRWSVAAGRRERWCVDPGRHPAQEGSRPVDGDAPLKSRPKPCTAREAPRVRLARDQCLPTWALLAGSLGKAMI